jgi:hypothetical protein
LVVQVRDPTDPACDYGCPSGDAIQVTATGLRTSIPGNYVPPTDFIVIYEVPTSGANCVGVVGTDHGCIEVQSCPAGQASCTITLSWNWNASYPGYTTTHVFEAWTINTAGNYPDYCSGKTWFQYSTSYIYPFNGATQIGVSSKGPVGAAGAGIAEMATAVPEGTAVSVRTYAIDPPLFDSNFSTYQCSSDLAAPPGVGSCTTLPGSFTYPNNQAFATPSTAGYAGCNSATIPSPPGWSWPSPLTDNGPFALGVPGTRYYISSQAVYIADPASNNVPCVGLSASQPQIGVSNWLAVSWFCPPTVAAVTAYGGSGQSAIAGTAFAHPLAAFVENSCSGKGLPGSAVTFTVPSGAATFAAGTSTETDVTAANGVATSSTLTAGANPRQFTATATDAAHTATYSLVDTCNPAWGAGISAVSGTPQSTSAGTAFALPLVARVTNQCGAPLQGATVTFAVPAGRASFANAVHPQSVNATTAADGSAASGPVTADPSSSGLGSYGGTATATFAGPSSPAGPVNYSLTNTCNGAIPERLAVAGGDRQSVSEGDAFAPLSVDVTNQCGGPWASGAVRFTGPADTKMPAVGFGVPAGPNSANAPAGVNGVAVSPIPFADDIAGALSVSAGIDGSGVTPVEFSLTIVPTAGSGPPILPTSQRRGGAEVEADATDATTLKVCRAVQRSSITGGRCSAPSRSPSSARAPAGASSRSSRRAHSSHPVDRGETTSSHRPGGTGYSPDSQRRPTSSTGVRSRAHATDAQVRTG